MRAWLGPGRVREISDLDASRAATLAWPRVASGRYQGAALPQGVGVGGSGGATHERTLGELLYPRAGPAPGLRPSDLRPQTVAKPAAAEAPTPSEAAAVTPAPPPLVAAALRRRGGKSEAQAAVPTRPNGGTRHSLAFNWKIPQSSPNPGGALAV